MIEIRRSQNEPQEKIKDSYDRIYSEKGLRQNDSFYLWLLRLLKPNPGKTLIDISCGEGRLVSLAVQMGLQATGVDFSFSAVSIGSRESPNLNWCIGNGECLPFRSHSFDYLTHIGSLEHYMDPQKGANEIQRLLKPDGTACILLPNTFGLLGNILYTLRHGDVFDDGQPLQRYGTLQVWKNILESAGLSLLHTYGYIGSGAVWPATRQDALWMISHPQKILRYLVGKTIPTAFHNHLVFICRSR